MFATKISSPAGMHKRFEACFCERWYLFDENGFFFHGKQVNEV